jgi:hypothetical protein
VSLRKQKGEGDGIVLLITAILMTVVVAIFVVIIGYTISRPTCYAQWEDSGMNVDWGFWSDCRVEVEPGKWIPADRYREIDE